MDQPTPKPDVVDHAKIEATLAQMTALLEQGKKTMAEVEEFYRKNNIQEGIGLKMLVGDGAPEWSRKLFGRLLLMTQNMKEDIKAIAKNLEEPKKAPRPVGARAASSRYRI
jgi:hypothetical protein